VQSPGYAQNYNRYTYCLNNPTKYIDPSGEWVHIVIGAAVGGLINLGIKACTGQINSWGDGFAAFGIGAVAGAVGAATGGAAFLAAGGGAAGAGGFLAGAAGGMVGSATSMPIQSIGNSAYFGDPMMTPAQYGIGILAGGVLGGAVNGGIAAFNGKTFWQGNVKPMDVSPTPTIKLNVPEPEIKLNTDWKHPIASSSLDDLPEEQVFQKIKYGDGNVKWVRVDASQTGSNTTNARILGIQGEKAVGTIGNKTRIPSLTGTAKYRIPDKLNSFNLIEVKNVSNLSFTRQLKDFYIYSSQTSRQFIIYTRPTTTFSSPLRDLINQGEIIIKPIPGL